VGGSALVPLLLGVGLGDLLHGLPINSSHEFTGNFFDLLTPYGLWTGLTLLLLSLLHGATFLLLKTTGELRERSAAAARVLVWPAAVVMLAFVIWTRAIAGPHFPSPLIALAAIAVLAAPYLISTRHALWAFATSAAGMAMAVVSIFVALYPNVVVSSTNVAYNLTVSNSSSAKYALTVMTVVAVVFLPLILLYQGWSYHVFRARIGQGTAPADSTPPATGPAATTEPAG
jgi:cytochrome d ubiquinol oxidase subunit II